MYKPLFIVFFSILIIGQGCSTYEKVLKSEDLAFKEKKALEYYEKKEYHKALPLFEELMSMYRGTQKAEEFYFYYAQSHYGVGDYLLAAFNFKNFATTYPGSKHAEEALFMNAKCYYELSPRSSLDQENTIKCIEQTQLFINAYPNSKYVDEANSMIDQMRRRLEKKDAEAARLYYDMENYKAASVAYKNLLKKYPDSPHADQIAFMALKSSYLYALKSIESRQQERLEATLEAYAIFGSRYPQSKYAAEAREISENAEKQLEKIKTKPTI